MAKTYLLISDEFSGEVNTASSLGSAPDAEIVGPKVGTDLKFKRLKAGNNVTLTDNGDNVEITASTPTAAANAFETFAVPNGVPAVADGATDTLTFTTTDNKVVITGSADDNIDFTVNEANLDDTVFDHDALTNFVANEHIDHTTVSITGGEGLTGGGNLVDGGDINLNIDGLLLDATPATTDYLVTYDVDQMNHKKVTIDSILPAPTPQADSFGKVITPDAVNIDAESPTDTLNLESGNTKLDITGNATTDTVTFTVQEGNIDHDALANFVANEHVDHSTVDVLGGVGLSNNGNTNISADITLDLDVPSLAPDLTPNTATDLIVTYDSDAGTHKKVVIDDILPAPYTPTPDFDKVTAGGVTVSADTVQDTLNLIPAAGNKVTLTGNNISKSISIDVNEANLDDTVFDHDTLTNFVANEHVDHTSVSITGGTGLQGGGDLTLSSTIDLDINSLTPEVSTDKPNDFVAYYDTSTGTHKKTSIQDIGGQGDVVGPASATDNAVARFDTTTGELLQDSSLSVTDNGEVLGVDGSSSNPTYSFATDTNTGVYSSSPDTLTVSAGGVNRLNVSGSSIDALTKINATSGLYRYSTSYSTTSTIQATDDVVHADATLGNIVLTLPSSLNMCVSITKIDASANTVTLQPTGADTILGQASYILDNQWDSIYLSRKSDGDWVPMTISSDLADNQVIDHSTVSISAGAGLSGGGDITTTRALSLDFTTITDFDATPSGGTDYVVTYDDSAGTHKKVLLNNLPGGGGGGSGDVTGPASSTDNAIVRFDGTTGKVIQDYIANPPTIDDNGVASFSVAAQAFSERIGAGSTIGGNSSTAFGFNAGADAVQTTAVGANATASGTTSDAFGFNSSASGINSVSLGAGSSTLGNYSVSVGVAASSNIEGVSIGYNASTTGTRNIAIGGSASSTAVRDSISIGNSSVSSADFSIAMGFLSSATGPHSICIGPETTDSGNFYNTLMGRKVISNGINNTIIGYLPTEANTGVAGSSSSNTVLGANVTYGSYQNTVVGASCAVSTDVFRATAVGYQADSTGSNSVTVGYDATCSANSVAVGAAASTSLLSATAVGFVAVASGADTTSIGALTDATGDRNIAIGSNAQSTGARDSMAIGAVANASSNFSNAIGYNANAPGTETVALGSISTAGTSGSIAIGYNTNSSHVNAIALGKSATTTKNSQMVIGAAGFGVTELVIGEGDSDTTATSNVVIRTTNGSGTDNSASADLVFAGSRGTGTGTGGHLIFQTANVGTTGSILNSLSTRMEIDENSVTVSLPLVNAQYTTGSLPTASSFEGATVYDSATNELKYSDGTTWVAAGSAGGGGTGDVTGPGSSVDNSIARYDGTTGKILNNYVANAPTIDDNGVPDFRDLSHASSQRIGLNSSVTGFSATAIGVSATAGPGCTVIGTGASSTNGGIAIGGTSSGLQSVAVGAASSSTGDNSVVIGYQADDNAAGASTVVGNFAQASVGWSTALGFSSQADGERSTAVGYDAHATGARSTILGAQSSDGGQNNCTIVGYGVSTDGDSNTLLGYNITKNGTVAATGNIAVGNGVVYGRFDNIAIGNQVSIGADLGRSIVIGRQATLSHTTTGSMNATVVGYSADSISSPSSTVIGGNAQANTASSSISLGNNATTGATEAIAIGVSAVADGIGSLALGRLADTNAQAYSIAIGRQVTTEAPNTCVIGNAGSVAITDFYLGGSYRNTHSLPIDVAIQPSRQRATGGNNVAGNKLILRTGTSSGTGAGGDFELYTAETGTVASNAENTTQNIMYKATSAQENIFTAKNAVTADGSLHNESISFYLDEATNELKVKVKYSNGTVKIGTVSNLPV